MSYPFFPPNKSKQQELEHKTKQITKVIAPQGLSDNAIEHMSGEDYARFIEESENARQSRIEIERKLRLRSDLKVYTSIALGVISIIIGRTGYRAGDFSGWVAISLAIIGIVLLVKYSMGTYGARFGWRGIVSFFLLLWGISLGIGALVALYSPNFQ